MKKSTLNEKSIKSIKNNNKGKDTRQIIVDAAKKIFAIHPYNAASIRMIASQGEFNHGLIRYYFPSKATIFEAVIKESCQVLCNANRIWLNEVFTLSPKEGLTIVLDRFIEFSQKNPEICQIIIQNLSHDDPSTLPGYQHIKDFFHNTQKDFEKIFNEPAPSADVFKFLNSLNILMIHYLGAKPIAADILGLDAKSDEYLKWLKETIIFIFLPLLSQYR